MVLQIQFFRRHFEKKSCLPTEMSGGVGKFASGAGTANIAGEGIEASAGCANGDAGAGAATAGVTALAGTGDEGSDAVAAGGAGGAGEYRLKSIRPCGLRCLPLWVISKCKWGYLLMPVEPTVPICCPVCTTSPESTSTLFK